MHPYTGRGRIGHFKAVWTKRQELVLGEKAWRVYSHALPEEEHDLAFADFAGSTGRHQTAPALAVVPSKES